jgi:uncharacterized protein with HEPN domain
MRSDQERLLDILEAIEKIEEQTKKGEEQFINDPMLQVWVVHYLQIIGEAASRVSESLKNQNPEIPWDKITGMRHVLVHGYFEIDLDIVWAAVENDLPELKRNTLFILNTFGNG